MHLGQVLEDRSQSLTEETKILVECAVVLKGVSCFALAIFPEIEREVMSGILWFEGATFSLRGTRRGALCVPLDLELLWLYQISLIC